VNYALWCAKGRQLPRRRGHLDQVSKPRTAKVRRAEQRVFDLPT
jgi:hypothetical protein